MAILLLLAAPLILLASGRADVPRPSAIGRSQHVEPIDAPPVVADSLPGRPLGTVDPRTGTDCSLATQRILLNGNIDSMWRPDTVQGLAARIAISRQLSIDDSQGGYYVAWVDETQGEPDIRMQRFGPNALVAEGWPLDGVPVCQAPGSQYQPDLATDGTDGVFLVWADFRSGVATLYAQHIGAHGAVVEGWPKDGKVIAGVGAPANPRVAASGDGGAFVVWEGRREGRLAVFGIRMGPDGAVSSGWPEEGVALSETDAASVEPQVVAAPNGRVLVAWRELAEESAFRARLIGPEVPNGAGLRLTIAQGARELSELALEPANGGDVIAVWSESRGAGASVRAQRLATQGALQERWTSGGELVQAGAFAPDRPVVHAGPDSGVAIAWGMAAAEGQTSLYMRRLGPEGQPAAGWEQGSRAICVSAGDRFSPALLADGSGALIATWIEPALTGSVHGSPQASMSLRAVTLVSAAAAPGRARVVWRVAGDPEHQYRGQRSVGDEPWRELEQPLMAGGDSLVLEERGLSEGAHVRYRLSLEGPGGQMNSDAVELVIPALPRLLELRAVRAKGPEHALLLAFALPPGEMPRADLMDVMGRRVAQTRFTGLDPGEQQVRWQLSPEIASGVYFLRLTQGSRSRGAKVIYVR